jgi:hypothetical protein
VSSDICDEDQKKRDYARSISKKTRKDSYWFRPSRSIIAIHPVLLYYAVEKLIALDELWAATYIDWRTALYIWQASNSITILTDAYPIETPG